MAAQIAAAGDPLAVPAIIAVACDPMKSRVLRLLLADRALTAEEWAEIEAAERIAAG
jgi:Trk K+ transport system NAD-binding subunit